MILGIGTDIVEVARITKAIERWGNHFLEHVYSEEEINYCLRHKYPHQHFAGRFAAKEAVVKALDDYTDLKWTDIRIVNDAHGKPICSVLNRDTKLNIHVSISHTKNHAIAIAIITQK